MMMLPPRDIGTIVLALLAVLVLVAAVIKGIRARKRKRDAARQEWRELEAWYSRSGMTAPPPENPKD